LTLTIFTRQAQISKLRRFQNLPDLSLSVELFFHSPLVFSWQGNNYTHSKTQTLLFRVIFWLNYFCVNFIFLNFCVSLYGLMSTIKLLLSLFLLKKYTPIALHFIFIRGLKTSYTMCQFLNISDSFKMLCPLLLWTDIMHLVFNKVNKYQSY